MARPATLGSIGAGSKGSRWVNSTGRPAAWAAAFARCTPCALYSIPRTTASGSACLEQEGQLPLPRADVKDRVASGRVAR